MEVKLQLNRFGKLVWICGHKPDDWVMVVTSLLYRDKGSKTYSKKYREISLVYIARYIPVV